MLYLDHAATSFPKAPGVSQAVAHFLDHQAGNPGRGAHRLAVAAARVVEEARERVAQLLGGDPERTLLGPGSTFWLNTLLGGLLGPGDRVVISALEHNAVMRPLRRLERERGLRVDIVQAAAAHGVPTAPELAAAVAAAPCRLVVLTQASNVSGAVLPVEEIILAVSPVPVVVDAAQTAGSLPLHFGLSGAAALVCSGHKGLLGPPGTGILLLAPGVLPAPLVSGGTGSRSESEEMPDFLPDRFEAGTANGPGLAGLAASCRYLASVGVEELHHRQQQLVAAARERLTELPGILVHGLAPAGAPQLATFSLGAPGRDVGTLAARLEREHGILARVGLHCAPAAHRTLGTFPDGTLRISFGPFLGPADLERLITALKDTTGG